jgi:drug/metabolite transporter (DMT)-like permease
VTLVALALVLASAAVHASWNLLVKRRLASLNGATLTWLLGAVSGVLLAPAAAWYLATGRVPLSGSTLPWLAGSAAIHVVYFLLLQRGYRGGDLSLVYPLARGTGPLLAGLGGMLLFAERATPLALAGAALVALGVFTLTGGASLLRDTARRRGIGLGLAVGALIGVYTLWDKHVVGPLAVPPLVFEWILSVSMAALVSPLALGDTAALRAAWGAHRGTVLLVAALSSLSYILFLTALAAAPVSRVAPARELSILIGTFLGARVLGEAEAPRRLAAAGAMTAGVVLLALS